MRTPSIAAIGVQSKSGSLGTSAAVAMLTRAVMRSMAVASRRAPMNADITTPPPTATNAARRMVRSARRRASWRNTAHHALTSAPSVDVRPSRIATTRSAAAAIAGSWVTSTIVWPLVVQAA